MFACRIEVRIAGVFSKTATEELFSGLFCAREFKSNEHGSANKMAEMGKKGFCRTEAFALENEAIRNGRDYRDADPPLVLEKEKILL